MAGNRDAMAGVMGGIVDRCGMSEGDGNEQADSQQGRKSRLYDMGGANLRN